MVKVVEVNAVSCPDRSQWDQAVPVGMRACLERYGVAHQGAWWVGHQSMRKQHERERASAMMNSGSQGNVHGSEVRQGEDRTPFGVFDPQRSAVN
jgi:hypothetical protein